MLQLEAPCAAEGMRLLKTLLLAMLPRTWRSASWDVGSSGRPPSRLQQLQAGAVQQDALQRWLIHAGPPVGETQLSQGWQAACEARHIRGAASKGTSNDVTSA